MAAKPAEIKQRPLKLSVGESGMATIEAIPIVIIFAVLFGYTYGLFGAIHSGTLNSIAARNYAFETFRNRSDLVIFRMQGGDNPVRYYTTNNRYHTVRSERTDGLEFFATERPLAKGLALGPDTEGRTEAIHSNLFSNPALTGGRGPARVETDISPIWLQIGYGICLNSRCEP